MGDATPEDAAPAHSPPAQAGSAAQIVMVGGSVVNSVVVATMVFATAFVGSWVSFGRKQRSGRGTEPTAYDGTGLPANL